MKTVDKSGELQTYYDADDETPFYLDSIFMAAAVAGLPEDSVRRAIGASPGVEQCPRCGEGSKYNKGQIENIFTKESYQTQRYVNTSYHSCGECGWSEKNDLLTEGDIELPRANIWIQKDDPDKLDPIHKFIYRQLPLVDDLPNPSQTVILDATPVPEAYALLFQINPDDITVTGEEPVELNATITQIVDGQYHRGTIANDERGKSLQDRLQRGIDALSAQHNRVIVVGHQKAKEYFEVPINAEWISFHSGRGLDFPKHDAVIIIGAPHTRTKDFVEDAKLLAMDQNAVRLGGEEHSTRRDTEVSEPVYRKYYYRDSSGMGRAVPTKSYKGLVGKLFRNRRENEIVQLAHRIRPTIADEEKQIYLLTNVPTELPVDNLVTLPELTEPVYHQLDITEGAVRLLELCVQQAEEGRAAEKNRWFNEWDENTLQHTVSGFHEFATSQKDGLDVEERTIRNYIKELQSLGIVEEGEYIQREGRTYDFDIATSKKALLILTNNTDFEVDTVRRLAEIVDSANESTEWIEWVSEHLQTSDESGVL
ncbi:hypothetical protein ACFQL1_11215 [Halomicroarcula sp. GCM10025709]|uniref:hypothetical protein n=1 Tax=Halomicroarcula sp. GCM10025709 TaxID=3252669 RepID=UPI00361028D0